MHSIRAELIRIAEELLEMSREQEVERLKRRMDLTDAQVDELHEQVSDAWREYLKRWKPVLKDKKLDTGQDSLIFSVMRKLDKLKQSIVDRFGSSPTSAQLLVHYLSPSNEVIRDEMDKIMKSSASERPELEEIAMQLFRLAYTID